MLLSLKRSQRCLNFSNLARRSISNWSKCRDEVKLSFKCTQCGKCCTEKQGIAVKVNDREIEEMAVYKGMEVSSFKEKFVKESNGELELKKSEKNLSCVFLLDKKCTIYSVRPTPCRTYPFMPHHLISNYDWHLAARKCEGIQLKNEHEHNVVSFDDAIKHAMAYEIHRSGEPIRHAEFIDLLPHLAEDDPSFLESYAQELAENFYRNIIYRDENVTVMDTFLDSAEPTRSFFFNDRLHLIQSEVALQDQLNEVIDHSKLVLDIHQAMCIPLAWLQSCLSIAVIGAGAGALPMFLYKNVDNISNLHAIEPSRTVNHIAKEYFGLIKEDPKDCFQLFEMTGEDFVEKSERKYDYIMVDVECGGDEGDGLAAPPQSMLQLDFLRNLKEMLTDDGVLGINVIANSEKAHKLVVKSVTQVFDHGAVLQLPRNEIFYLMKSPQEALGNKEMLIKILEHSHLKQLHKFTQEILQDPHVNLEMLK